MCINYKNTNKYLKYQSFSRLVLSLKSQHKGQVAIPIGKYFQHLELPLFVFVTFNLHDENYAHTHTEKAIHLFQFGYNFPQHNRDRLSASLLDTYKQNNNFMVKKNSGIFPKAWICGSPEHNCQLETGVFGD